MTDTDRVTLIKIDLDVDEESGVEDITPRTLGSAMDPEIRKFDQWFQKQGNEPLVMAERAILKTYLGWKLKFEDKD